ncbi:unnamed protein product [Soboliphyme baturini]|uniref:VM domain-containing protein n=1 Tax=Soboliphyme baturini TaxID=241478 RepID=A0A183J3M0_9BILA|nr:unnamed protein product [Soboliphyme baturini]
MSNLQSETSTAKTEGKPVRSRTETSCPQFLRIMAFQGAAMSSKVALYAVVFLFSIVVVGRPEPRRYPYAQSACPNGSPPLQLCDARRPTCPPQYYCYAVGTVDARLYGCCTEMLPSYYPQYPSPYVNYNRMRQRLSPQSEAADVSREAGLQQPWSPFRYDHSLTLAHLNQTYGRPGQN